MKALESLYRGFRFRSRLEARWAVFMDAMGVAFEYEREAYDLDGMYYLPDFWLPEMKAHLEIKPESPTDEEEEKMRRLVAHTKRWGYTCIGSPEVPDSTSSYDGGAHVFIWNDDEYGQGVGSDFGYQWCECPRCHRCELQFDGRADRISCNCPTSEHGDKGYNYKSERLVAAYTKAKSYRFEPSARNL